MAKSKYEYVKQFESDDHCLPNCWMVVRLDGKGFHKFSDCHEFEKPNDKRGLDLMTKSAVCVMEEFKEIILAYGESDEYSFVFRKNTNLYKRRSSKILTNVCSLFASSFVFYWTDFFSCDLKYPPTFDGRVVLYPSDKNLRDYLSWRQVDCHINNLYNTTFWTLVQCGGLSRQDAEKRIRHTVSKEKNEILFSEFGVNYNKEPEQFKKGTVIVKCKTENSANGPKSDISVKNLCLSVLHTDIIAESFWLENKHILGNSE